MKAALKEAILTILLMSKTTIYNPPPANSIRTSVRAGLIEDLQEPNMDISTDISADADISATLIDEDKLAQADLYCNEEGVLCGTQWFDESFLLLDADIQIKWRKKDGDKLQSGDKLCDLVGKARPLLAGERSALNFLQTLSGTATKSASLATLLPSNSSMHILDTRKTIPGLREAQKYAVRVGGCHNHRVGLYDAFLIKENHIAVGGGIIPLLHKAAQQKQHQQIIVEVESIEQLRQILNEEGLRVDVVMLDNFTLAQIKQAVELRREFTARDINNSLQIEVSGGMDASKIAELIKLGVDRVSMGVLTKDCKSIDFSLRFRE